MNIEAVESFVRRELKESEIDFVQNCREAVQFLHVAMESIGDDLIQTDYLVYVDPKTGDPCHYALQITGDDDEALLINPIKAAMFPKFIGPKDEAPKLFALMKVTEEIR